MVIYEGQPGIPQLPVLQKSLIVEINRWVNIDHSSGLIIHLP